MLGKSIPGNRLLFALATQGFDAYYLLGQFVVTQDQCIQRTALVGLLELAFEAASAGIDLQAQVWQLITNTFAQRQGSQFSSLTESTQVNINLTCDFCRDLLKGFEQ